MTVYSVSYRNDPKYWDRQACVNSVEPDQTAPEDCEEQTSLSEDVPVGQSSSKAHFYHIVHNYVLPIKVGRPACTKYKES